MHPADPVLKPDKPWETAGKSNVAYPYSGGVWYDPARQLFSFPSEETRKGVAGECWAGE